MSVLISGVRPRSPAQRAGIRPGEALAAINGNAVDDVLDYRFYMTDERLELELIRDGVSRRLRLHKGEYEDLGLEFDTYLMDKQRSCRNRCAFCFIDQLPQGLREPLYFKDDDSRMSFLFGNYITLTNLGKGDIDRILQMHISPVNVSIHTTNPTLRAEMMGNRHAGEVLEYLPRLARAGIRINGQLVLCPGLNDGAELERTLADLADLAPSLQSVAAVPVGLTRYREGLPPLEGYTSPGATKVLDAVHAFGDRMLARHGARTFFASDEFYLLAGRELPDYDHYEDFHQLENGVGMLRLLLHEFHLALGEEKRRTLPARRVTLATGTSAHPFLQSMARRTMERFPGLELEVVPIVNRFFGESITVAGLVTGKDLADQLSGRPLGAEVLFPSAMLRHEGDLFLDGMSLDDLAKRLDRPVRPVPNDGFALLEAMLSS